MTVIQVAVVLQVIGIKKGNSKIFQLATSVQTADVPVVHLKHNYVLILHVPIKCC